MKTEKFIYDMHIYLTFVSKRHCFLWLAMFGYAVVVLLRRAFVKHFALEKRWSWGCTHTSFRTPSQFWHASEWNEQLKSAHNLIKDVKRGSELWPNDRCQIVAFVGLGVFRFTSFIWCSLACLLDCLASLPPAVGPLITILGVRVQKSKV